MAADWTAKQWYDFEVGVNKFVTGMNYTCYNSGWPTTCTINDSTTYNAKVGLIYLSDYLFHVATDWTSDSGLTSGWLNYLNTDSNSTLGFIWTITRRLDYMGKNNVWGVGQWGLSTFDTNINNFDNYPTKVHPAFYLDTNIKYVSGSGSKSDPYRIS